MFDLVNAKGRGPEDRELYKIMNVADSINDFARKMDRILFCSPSPVFEGRILINQILNTVIIVFLHRIM